MNTIETIHPVIMPVSLADQQLKGRDKVAALRRDARKALAICTQYSNCQLDHLDQDENGAPLPSNGIYWSLSHKEAYVAAVASRKPVGIDIEKIKSVTQGVEKRIATKAEWDLAPRDLDLFFRYWTAKEAVLKAIGIGLTGLDDCHIRQIPDDRHLVLSYKDQNWTVSHHWVGQEHLAAVTSDGVDIQWHEIC